MQITSFTCTIEVNKDKNGYSNNYYVDITDKGVSISHPYVIQSPKQVMFITKLIHDFIGATIDFNDKVNIFNRNNRLEQQAKVVPPVVETAGSDFDLDAESAVIGEARPPEGSNSAQAPEVSTVKTEVESREIEEDID